MKKICMLCLLCAAVLFTNAQSQLPGQSNGMVVYVSAESGTITVNSTAVAKTVKESSEDAAAGVIYTLLFRGVPGSPYSSPMIANEAEGTKNPAVIALLNGGYKSFITENTKVGQEDKKKKQDGVKGKQVTYKITVNCEALRRHLEQNSAVRKFGL